MRIVKKSLACLLSVILLLTCIPLSAAAASAGTVASDGAGGAVVTITDIDHSNSETIEDAINDALSSSTYTLANITKIEFDSSASGDVTLDTTDLDYIWDYTTGSSGGVYTALTGLKILDLSDADLSSVSDSIPNNQFRNAATLTQVILPSTVTSIGTNAFDGCTSLSTFDFSSLSALSTIGNYAFQGTALTTVTMPVSLASIGTGTFDESKITTLDLSSSTAWTSSTITAASLGFSYTVGGSVTLPSLATLNLPSNITTISANAFDGYTNLSSVNFPALTWLATIGDEAFQDTALAEVDLTYTDVVEIPDAAFKGCVKLETVRFNVSTTSIGESAFEDCTILKNANLNSLTLLGTHTTLDGIGKYAFKNTALVTVDLTSTQVIELLEEAFSNCTSLTTFYLNTDTTDIEDSVFDGSTSLKTMNLGNLTDLINLGDYAFRDTALTVVDLSKAQFTTISLNQLNNIPNLTEVKLPTTVAFTSIGANAFNGCTKLTTVNFDDLNDLSVIGANAFENSGLTSVDLSNTLVNAIQSEVFKDCTQLLTVTLKTDTGSIGSEAFSGCTSLNSVNFSALTDLTLIGTEAFAGTALTTLNLTGLTSSTLHIDDSAFENCASLQSVDLSQLTTTAVTFDTLAFSGCSSLSMINLKDTTNVATASNNDVFGTTTLPIHPVVIVVDNPTLYNSTTWTYMETNDFVTFTTYITAPQNLTAKGSGDNEITFYWDEPAYVDSSVTVEWEFSVDGGITWHKQTALTSSGGAYQFAYNDPDDDLLTTKNYTQFNVALRAVVTDSTGAVSNSPTASYNNVMLVPTNAESPEFYINFTKKTHSIAENSGTTTFDIGVAATDNIIAGRAVASSSTLDYGTITYQLYYDTDGSLDPSRATAVGSSLTIDASTTGSWDLTATYYYYENMYQILADSSLPAGEYYFFVAATNTNPLAASSTSTTPSQTTAVSNYNKVVVYSSSAPAAPVITTQPKGASYVLNATADDLAVVASSPDSGSLSYTWYYSTSEYGTYTAVGTDSPTYTPDTSLYGTYYYYVRVGNTSATATGTTVTDSDTAVIVVTPETPVITDPISASYNVGDTATALSAKADALSDGGKLTYQWYVNTTNSNTGGTEISGATTSSYTPNTSTAGTLYYYVVVTNTNRDSYGRTAVATATSAVAAISVLSGSSNDAALPVLSTVSNVSAVEGATATLSVSVTNITPSTTSTLSYQWYRCDDASGSNPSAVGTDSASYTPDTTTAGTYYYFVMVTHTDTTATGTQTVSRQSNIATVTVTVPLANAETPALTGPADTSANVGTTARLSVTVSGITSSEAKLSYQWYQCDDANGTNPVAVGTDSASYTPDTSTAGTYYYYVTVTNNDSSATTTKTASANSRIATLTVSGSSAEVNAEAPVFSKDLPDVVAYEVDAADAEALTVITAPVTSGTVTYQWYSCNADGTDTVLITGATGSSYTPDVSTAGTYYYYVVATNTDPSATGNTTTSTQSSIVTVNVADEFTVTFMNGDEELTDLTTTVAVNGKVEQPDDPTAEAGYEFTGWYTDPECTQAYDFDAPVTGNLTLYAGWEALEGWHFPYVAGYEDGTFGPNNSITRKEAAQMFYNMMGYPDPDDIEGTDITFPDVNYSGWYGDAVLVLSRLEIVKGDDEGNFRPNDTISRAEFASIVQLYFELEDGDATKLPFTDVESGHWAKTAIAAVYEAGYVVGTNDDGTLFEPNIDISRAMAVSLLNKAQGRFTNEEMWEGVKIPFSDVTTDHWGWTQIMEAAVAHEHPEVVNDEDADTAAEE